MVAPLRALVEELHQLAFGRRPHVAPDLIRGALVKAAEAQGVSAVPRFLVSEWTHIVDAWRLRDAEDYAAVPRLGRRSRMSAKQRERLWLVFAAQKTLNDRGVFTWPQIFRP